MKKTLSLGVVIIFIVEGKHFRQRISYLVHRRIHTGVMPYKCTACNKNFRYKVSQKSHKCSMNNSEPLSDIFNNQSDDKKRENTPDEESKDSKASTSKKIVSEVDYGGEQMESSNETEKSEVLKTSILVSCNPLIEISYNAADLQSAMKHVVTEDVVPTKEDSIPRDTG